MLESCDRVNTDEGVSAPKKSHHCYFFIVMDISLGCCVFSHNDAGLLLPRRIVLYYRI